MTDAPALVILAAGVGSRYGGPKQLEPVGPGGATLMDYSIYDARRAGFPRVVLVVHPDLEVSFRALVRERYAGRMDVAIALQRLEDLPAGVPRPGRAKPWGTAHAVLAAERDIRGSFAVLNADDFYGRGAVAQAAQFLSGPADAGRPVVFANVAYPVGETLSATGGVNRALFRLSEGAWMETVEEIFDIRRAGDGSCTGADASGRGPLASALKSPPADLTIFTRPMCTK